MDIYSEDSFISLIVLDGNINIKWDKDKIKVKKGDSIFIPAKIKTKLEGNAEIIFSYI